MRQHEFPIIAFAALLGLAASAHADPSDYGKVDTFQPGKKYNCVPTADRKGWDCNVTGNADVAPAPAQPPAATPAPTAPPASAPVPEATPAAPPTQPAPGSGALPNYLNNPAMNGAMRPMPAAPAPKPVPPPRVKGPQVPAQRSTAPAANPPLAPPQPAPAKPAALAPNPAPAMAVPPAQAGQDFLALPAAQYVIELAHADSAAGIDAARTAAHPAHGEVYELHLSQNGNESWLLLWGPFADLQAARAARDELAAQGATPGWPRRIGPLQSEARHADHE